MAAEGREEPLLSGWKQKALRGSRVDVRSEKNRPMWQKVSADEARG